MSKTAMERLSARFQITDSNLESGQFEGMASVFGSLVEGCMYPTIIHPGAFLKTLQERASRVKVLWQHNPDWPIGKPVLLQETEVGLKVRAQISKTALGTDAMTLIRDGVVDELSIGFDPIKFDFETKEGTELRHLRELRLWEFSPVTFAADPMARITEANRAAMRLAEPPTDPLVPEFQEAGIPDELTRLTTFYTWLHETHEGKVLSKKNKTLVQDAIAALQALLTAAEPPASDDEAQALTRRVEALVRDLELDAMVRRVPLLTR